MVATRMQAPPASAPVVERARGFAPAELSARVNPSILEEQHEDAVALWQRREHAIAAPHYELADLAEIDDRLEADLEALAFAGRFGIELATAALATGAAGELFCLTTLAVVAGDRASFEHALALAGDPKLGRGLDAALAWLPFELVEAWVLELLPSSDPTLARVALAACANHRRDRLGARLARACMADDQALRVRALRAVGELGRDDLVEVTTYVQQLARDDASQLAAIASQLRLGRCEGAWAARLWAWIVAGHEHALPSAMLAARGLDLVDAHAWFQELQGSAPHRRWAIELAGQLGDPALVDALIEWMATPALARAAGAALTLITGVDLADHDLDGDAPEGFDPGGPNDDSDDEDVALEREHDLVWPRPERVAAWWAAQRGRFEPGIRVLAGQAPSAANCRALLERAPQLVRGPAAFELARQQPSQPSFELRAPAARQRRWLREASAR